MVTASKQVLNTHGCCRFVFEQGGWGSIEYGTPVKGQVIGGRWKPLHHMMRQSAYADVTAACGKSSTTMMDASDDATGPALCYVRNDLPQPFKGTVTVSALHYGTGAVTLLGSSKVSLPAGGGALGFFCAGVASASPITPTGSYSASCPTFADVYTQAGCTHNAADCMLNVTVTGSTGQVLSTNMMPLALPAALNLPAATVTHTVAKMAAGAHSVDVTLRSDQTAVFVWLTTAEHGRFTDNSFMLLPGKPVTVQFLSFLEAGTSSAAVESSLRVEHLAMYCSRTAGMPCH